MLTRILLPTFSASSRTWLLVAGRASDVARSSPWRVELADEAEAALVFRGLPERPGRVDQARLAVGAVDPIFQIIVAGRAQRGNRRRIELDRGRHALPRSRVMPVIVAQPSTLAAFR